MSNVFTRQSKIVHVKRDEMKFSAQSKFALCAHAKHFLAKTVPDVCKNRAGSQNTTCTGR